MFNLLFIVLMKKYQPITKNSVLLITILLCFFGCNKNDSKTTKQPLDALVKTNLNVKNNIKQRLAKGNDGATIANWFPETLLDYQLDPNKKDIGEGSESRAAVVYIHPNDVAKNITINVWDGNGSLALAVNNMIAMSLDGTGEEKNSQLRQKVYLRNGRKAAEREIFQSSQVNISFEVDGRFYVTARSDNNTLETLWEMADLLNFKTLK